MSDQTNYTDLALSRSELLTKVMSKSCSVRDLSIDEH